MLVGGQNDNDIVVVTSGTLADSLKDQIDDLDNSPMVPLQKLIKNCPVPAHLAQGTADGVKIRYRQSVSRAHFAIFWQNSAVVQRSGWSGIASAMP
ncbi:hypothetical protein [Pseudomonas sp. Z1-6]|uniref:hypothetical protein n=1 Tax=unclassified Pseudomonas TaxID=196821 RepID=UPI003DA81CFF